MSILNLNMRVGLSLTSWFFLLFFLLLSLPVSAPAQQAAAKEYQIKAVFLFNFTQFVQWPADAFRDPESPLVIGVLGEDRFGPFLDQTVTGEEMENHNLVVERYASIDDIKDCHILFVSLTDKQVIRRALDKVKSKPVLTVSDSDGFARSGGMIAFFNADGKTRLRINVDAVTEGRLVVSSKLLRLAEIVQGKNN